MKKKILKLITAWALILCMTAPTMLSVQAEGDVVGDAIEKETFVVQHHSFIDGYRNDVFTAPDAPAGYSDYLFAGWYADEDCETGCDEAVSGEAYAKYVHKDVLGVKAQIRSATYFGTETSDIRFISTVDSLDYQEVGFNITMYGTTTPYTTDTVYKQLYAMNSTDILTTYTPDLFHETSIRFFACTVSGVTNDAFDYGIQVQPYWITCDGTTVTADTVTKSVSNGYMNKAMDADVTEAGTLALDSNYTLQGGSLGGKYYYLVATDTADTTVYRLAQNAEGTGWDTTEEAYKSVGHTGITASDITYNGKDGNLVMVSGSAVSYVDRSALTALDGSATAGFEVASIKHNKNHDKYVAMLADGTVKVLDSAFAATGVATTVPDDLADYTAQSVTADDSYIFQAFSNDTDGVIANKIAVYDWSGNYVATIVVALTDKTIETIDINKNTISAACTTTVTEGETTVNQAVIYNVDILRTFDIVYNLDGGTTTSPTRYTKNSGTINISEPTRYGYEFLGWSEETVSLSGITWRTGLASATNGSLLSTTTSKFEQAESTEGFYLKTGLLHTLMYGKDVFSRSLSGLRWRLYTSETLEQDKSAGTFMETSVENEGYPYAVLALQYPDEVDKDKLYIKSEFVKPQTMTYTIDETEETYEFENWTKGFINTGDVWSVSYNKSGSEDAIYSDEIELKAGVEYTIANYDGTQNKIRWRLITKNDEGVVTNVSDAGVYEKTYTPEADCTVRIMMLPGRVDYTDAVIKAGSTGDRTYTASWIRNSFKVQYDANGGVGAMEDSIHEFADDKQLSANAFTNEGYGFVGWSTSPEGEVVYADKAAVTNLTTDESITLYAQWSPSFSISYEYGEDAVAPAEGNPTSYTAMTPSFKLNEPTREGYEFAGWTETISLNQCWHTGKVHSDGTIDKEKTGQSYSDLIYLQKGRSYTVNVGTLTDEENFSTSTTLRWRVYNLDGTFEESKGAQTYTAGSSCYVRIWMQQVDVSSTEDGSKAIIVSSASSMTVDQGTTGNRTYTANWKLPTYNCTVAYNSNAPEGLEAVGTMENSSHVNGVASTLSANAYEVDGYAFTSWNTEADGTGTTYGNGATVTELATSANEEVTLYAQWTNEKVFTIAYNLDGGTLVDGGINPTSYAATTENFTLTEPTKEGYTFAGWTETISFAGNWKSGYLNSEGTITNHDTRYYSDYIYLDHNRAYTFDGNGYTTSKGIRWWTYSTDKAAITTTYNAYSYPANQWDTDRYVRFLLVYETTETQREGMTLTSSSSTITLHKGTTGNITYTATWTENATE